MATLSHRSDTYLLTVTRMDSGDFFSHLRIDHQHKLLGVKPILCLELGLADAANMRSKGKIHLLNIDLIVVLLELISTCFLKS